MDWEGLELRSGRTIVGSVRPLLPYTLGVGVGYETPSQQQNAYDSDQDRDTDQIRRRETKGYESAHGEETSIREGLLAGFASMDPRSFRCSGSLLISCRGVILMLRDAVTTGGRLAHGRSHRAFSSSSYEQNFANLAAAQMEPASGPSNPSIYAATDQEHGHVVRSLGTQYTWGLNDRLRVQAILDETLHGTYDSLSREVLQQLLEVNRSCDMCEQLCKDEATAACLHNMQDGLGSAYLNSIWRFSAYMQGQRRDRALGLMRHYHRGKGPCQNGRDGRTSIW